MKHCWGVTVKLTDKKSSQDLFWIAAVYLVQVVACEHSCLLSFPVASSLSEETTSRMTKPKARAWVAAFLERKKKTTWVTRLFQEQALSGRMPSHFAHRVPRIARYIPDMCCQNVIISNSPVVSDLSSSQELCLRSPWKEIEKQSSRWGNVLLKRICVMHGFSLNLTSKYYCL